MYSSTSTFSCWNWGVLQIYFCSINIKYTFVDIFDYCNLTTSNMVKKGKNWNTP